MKNPSASSLARFVCAMEPRKIERTRFKLGPARSIPSLFNLQEWGWKLLLIHNLIPTVKWSVYRARTKNLIIVVCSNNAQYSYLCPRSGDEKSHNLFDYKSHVRMKKGLSQTTWVARLGLMIWKSHWKLLWITNWYKLLSSVKKLNEKTSGFRLHESRVIVQSMFIYSFVVKARLWSV